MKNILITSFLLFLAVNLGFSQDGDDPIGQGNNSEEPWPSCIDWCTGGNYNTFGGYLGTNDHLPLIFKTDYRERMRVTESGEVGIGVTNPQSLLDVATSIRASANNSNNFIELYSNQHSSSINTYGDFYNWNTGDQNFVFGQNGTNSFNIYGPASSNKAFTILGSNGRVGIGTDTPSAELEVKGDIKFGINLSGKNTTERTTLSFDTPFTGAYVRMYGENHPSDPGRLSLVSNSSNGGGEISFLDYTGSGYHESMIIKADGKIGIGTNNPQANLHVSGGVRLDNLANTNNTTVVVTDNNGDLSQRNLPPNIWDGDDQELTLNGGILSIDNGNSVTLPSGADDLGNHRATSNLDMDGFSIANLAVLQFDNVGQANIIEFAGGNGPVIAHDPNTGLGRDLEILADEVIISTPSGLTANGGAEIIGFLNVTGNSVLNGNLDVNGTPWTNTNWTVSDRRFKKDINTIEGALDKILHLEGKTYAFRVDEFKHKNFESDYEYGFIAQELKEVLPETVRKGTDGYYGVSYTQLIPVLTEAIKEQNQVVVDQQEKIENLENRLAKLEAFIFDSDTTSKYLQDDSENHQIQKPIKEGGLTVTDDGFSVHPNPFQSTFSIRFSEVPEKEGNIQVYNLSGQLVKQLMYTIGEQALQVDLSELPSGNYLIKTKLDNQIQQQIIVKQ